MDILNDIKSNVLDIEEFNFYNEFQLLSSILESWHKKSQNKKLTDKARAEIDSAIKSLSTISLYVMSMQQRQRGYNVQLNRFRDATIAAETKLKNLQYETKKLRE
tara:strand:+ start:574 stop:888 length:315 start_codon:yes stop_codon:yes gene_type:complete